jgi:hypothetical protein
MHRLILGLAGLAVLSSCSDQRDRRITDDGGVADLVEMAQADSSQPDTASAAAPPGVEETPAEPRRGFATAPTRAARAPAASTRTHGAPEPAAAPDSAQAPVASPAPTPTSEPGSDTGTRQASDSADTPGRDTTLAPPEVSATAAPDSAQAPAASPGPTPTSEPAPSSNTGQTSDSAASPGPDTTLARLPVPVPDPTAAPGTTKVLAVPAGTQIRAALSDSVNSRHDSAGKVVIARVIGAVITPNGQIVVPAGAAAQLTVTELKPAKSKSEADGKLAFRLDGISIGGRLEAVTADVQPVPHELRGRGVTGSEVGKVGVGAAVGAVAGRVITGKKKGAVVGGVIGAAGGAVVAAETANRDVVVPAGSPVVMVLRAPLVARAP